MMDGRSVSDELHLEIERFLYREARMLDGERMREWLETVADPAISYQLVIQQERFRRDKSPPEAREIMPLDEDHAALELRVRQFESGLQTMLDPPQRMRRLVLNVEAFHAETEGEFHVLSNGIVSRYRRQYERELAVFGRTDLLRRDSAGKLRLVSRRVDWDERVVRNKNLMFLV
jgi:3-phenylpropionate/cinnamic acid dioxygenase small subunit